MWYGTGVMMVVMMVVVMRCDGVVGGNGRLVCSW